MSSLHANESALADAARSGGQKEFALLAERYRPELQVHCYRMLGSFQDAEDMVQETLLRAWRQRASFEGRATFRAWLYRIATNACLDALERRSRRVIPLDVAPPADPGLPPLPAADLPWLQPYPDRLLEAIEEASPDPGALLVARETIELAFLVAIQRLPPRQRAVLVLRDALGWPASETAALLGTSVASANSALQRARATLRTHLPAERLDWGPAGDPDEAERLLLRRYMDAWELADVGALVALLREDARMTMPPTPSWYEGREAIGTFLDRYVFGSDGPGRLLLVPTRANRQPAFGIYLLRNGQTDFQPFALKVLRVQRGAIAEIAGFVYPELFPAFGLPPTPA